MRLTTAIWLGVFMRLESARGAYVTVVRKGAQQAGVPFVIHNHHDGSYDVYGPAPQSMFDDTGQERLFERVLEKATDGEKEEYLARQMKFDSDIWIVETESGNGEISLPLANPL